MTPLLSLGEVEAYLRAVFPQADATASGLRAVSVAPGVATVRLEPGDRHLRPGGTVSGPSLFGLADYAAYVVILAHVGPVGLAVTTSAQMDFLLRPAPGPLACEARLLKLGRRLAVTEARVTDEAGALVARASLTYSLPPGWETASAKVAAEAEAGG